MVLAGGAMREVGEGLAVSRLSEPAVRPRAQRLFQPREVDSRVSTFARAQTPSDSNRPKNWL